MSVKCLVYLESMTVSDPAGGQHQRDPRRCGYSVLEVERQCLVRESLESRWHLGFIPYASSNSLVVVA